MTDCRKKIADPAIVIYYGADPAGFGGGNKRHVTSLLNCWHMLII